MPKQNRTVAMDLMEISVARMMMVGVSLLSLAGVRGWVRVFSGGWEATVSSLGE